MCGIRREMLLSKQFDIEEPDEDFEDEEDPLVEFGYEPQ
jgi:hypothetical protein